MKKNPVQQLILLFPVLVLLTSCYSSRTYEYPFDSKNLGIIRNTLEHGKVGCENCYWNRCVYVSDSSVTEKEYRLTGKCALYTYHLIAKSASGGSEITLKIKCALLVGRSKKSENYFLDEVAGALFNSNDEHIRSALKPSESDREKMRGISPDTGR
jgi:hypothetical protein